jgi:hypothetical protein
MIAGVTTPGASHGKTAAEARSVYALRSVDIRRVRSSNNLATWVWSQRPRRRDRHLALLPWSIATPRTVIGRSGNS